MRFNVTKLFFAWQLDKEEKWLNEMSAKGFHLVNATGIKYTFEDNPNEVYTYKIELLERFPSHPESIAYIRFLEETGVEHIASVMRWAYFRKKTSEGPFELYSDITSKIKHMNRIKTLFFCVLPVNLYAVALNIIYYINGQLTVNIVCATISACFCLLIGYGILKTTRAIRKLKKESVIRE